MLFGICTAIENEENVKIASSCGFDYVEGNFGMLAGNSEDKRRAAKENIETYGLKCLAANCFMPGEMKIYDYSRNKKAFSEYIKRGLDFGVSLGLERVVFGSGGARAVPENAVFAEGFLNAAEFLAETASPIFERYGVSLVIEPLRASECNLVNTVKEAAMLCAASGAKNVFALADIFHMEQSGDVFSNIKDLKGIVRHSHISYPYFRNGHERTYPRSGDDCKYSDFINAVKYAGCNTCSIEARTDNLAADAPSAIDILRRTDITED